MRFGMGGTIGSTLLQDKMHHKIFRPLLRTKLLPTNLTAYQSHLVAVSHQMSALDRYMCITKRLYREVLKVNRKYNISSVTETESIQHI